MRLTLISAPASEPLQLSEVKSHLPVDGTDDDTRLTNLIKAVREYVEGQTSRQLITATWDGKLDRFPCGDREVIEISLPPLQSIASIKYLDTEGSLITWPNTDYVVDAPAGPFARAGRMYLAYGKTWPTTRDIQDAVTIQFVAGYGGASSVPQGIKEAMLLLIGHYNEHREAVVEGSLTEVPLGLEALVRRFGAVSGFVIA